MSTSLCLRSFDQFLSTGPFLQHNCPSPLLRQIGCQYFERSCGCRRIPRSGWFDKSTRIAFSFVDVVYEHRRATLKAHVSCWSTRSFHQSPDCATRILTHMCQVLGIQWYADAEPRSLQEQMKYHAPTWIAQPEMTLQQANLGLLKADKYCSGDISASLIRYKALDLTSV